MTDDELDAIHERQSARRRTAHKYSATTIADIDALIAHVTNLTADLDQADETIIDLRHLREHDAARQREDHP